MAGEWRQLMDCVLDTLGVIEEIEKLPWLQVYLCKAQSGRLRFYGVANLTVPWPDTDPAPL